MGPNAALYDVLVQIEKVQDEQRSA
jgi:hypothetical protein